MEYTEVFVWGSDDFGQLGLGKKQPGRNYNLPKFCSFNIRITAMSCGDEHSCFISDKGHVYSMGNNYEGRLGLGDRSIVQSSSPRLVESLLHTPIVGIACGWGHSLACSQSGQVFSWGLGESGALGTGDLVSQWGPVELCSLRRVTQVSAGSRHSGALCEDGGVFMWGSGESGQLGTGHKDVQALPVSLQAIERIRSISLGVFHSLFLSTASRVYACGGNSGGQLGIGHKKPSCVPVKVKTPVLVSQIAAGCHSACLSDRGELFVWGTGSFGECLVPRKIFDGPGSNISIGGSFGAVLDSRGGLFVWGHNSNGELAQGDFEERPMPVPVASLDGKRVVQVFCGGSFCICLGRDVRNERETRTVEIRQPEFTEDQRQARTQVEYLKSKLLRESDLNSRLQMENQRLSIEISVLKSREDPFAMHDLDKQMNAKNQEIENLVQNNRQLNSDYQLLQSELSALKQSMPYRHDTLEKENQLLKEQILAIDRKSSETVHSEVQMLREENLRVKENYTLQISDLERLLGEQKVAYKQVESDREIISAHNKRLERALEEAESRLAESKQQQYQRESEKMHMSSTQIDNLSSQLNAARSEISRLKNLVDESAITQQRMETEYHDMSMHNNSLKHDLDDFNLQIEKLHRELNEQIADNTRLSQINANWEQKFRTLAGHNEMLQGDINDLDIKNKQLFSNLQNELATRAREYRERTMHMLNTPLRGRAYAEKVAPASVSPIQNRHHDHWNKPSDTPSKLLDVLHQYSPQYLASPSRNQESP